MKDEVLFWAMKVPSHHSREQVSMADSTSVVSFHCFHSSGCHKTVLAKPDWFTVEQMVIENLTIVRWYADPVVSHVTRGRFLLSGSIYIFWFNTACIINCFFFNKKDLYTFAGVEQTKLNTRSSSRCYDIKYWWNDALSFKWTWKLYKVYLCFVCSFLKSNLFLNDGKYWKHFQDISN